MTSDEEKKEEGRRNGRRRREKCSETDKSKTVGYIYARTLHGIYINTVINSLQKMI